MIKDMDFASEHLTMNASFSYDGSVVVWDLAMRKDVHSAPAGVLEKEIREFFETLNAVEKDYKTKIEAEWKNMLGEQKQEAENGVQLSAVSEG